MKIQFCDDEVCIVRYRFTKGSHVTGNRAVAKAAFRIGNQAIRVRIHQRTGNRHRNTGFSRLCNESVRLNDNREQHCEHQCTQGTAAVTNFGGLGEIRNIDEATNLANRPRNTDRHSHHLARGYVKKVFWLPNQPPLAPSHNFRRSGWWV